MTPPEYKWVVLATAITFGGVVQLAYNAGKASVEIPPSPETIVEQTVFNVDGVTCYFASNPEFQYLVSEQYVRVTIGCGTEVLFHHLPAVERTQ